MIFSGLIQRCFKYYISNWIKQDLRSFISRLNSGPSPGLPYYHRQKRYKQNFNYNPNPLEGDCYLPASPTDEKFGPVSCFKLKCVNHLGQEISLSISCWMINEINVQIGQVSFLIRAPGVMIQRVVMLLWNSKYSTMFHFLEQNGYSMRRKIITFIATS